MRLAWNNLVHDRLRFGVTVLGIAFAVFLMIFQGSLLFSFLAASSKVIDSTDAELWITARGVPCFDFSSPLPLRFREIAQGVPGVESVKRLLVSFAQLRKADGQSQMVALIGAEVEGGQRLPLPRVEGTRFTEPDGAVVDHSHAALLGITRFPTHIELNRLRAKVVSEVTGFSSFLGCPYLFVAYPDAARFLGTASEETSYLLVDVAAGQNIERVKRELQRRLPDVDVVTRQEFALRSQTYWITQTGAGGAILTAAMLGFMIGLVVASQMIYATTIEKIEEFATLKAMGASRWFIIRVVLTQALACGVAGSVLGLLVTDPAVKFVREQIAWLGTPSWLPWAMLPPALAMCCLAAMMSVRAALTAEPARVFRA